MFVGHYAASLALKKIEPRTSLGTLFLAVQFVDILFFPFVMLGIERLNLIENFTQSTHFELVYMPYTHSLLATVLWATLIYLLFRVIRGATRRIACVIAIGVLSHWFLDLVVHTPDLPLWTDNSTKFGFGLWNNAPVTYLLEAVLLLIGLMMYHKATKPKVSLRHSKIARYGIAWFVIVLLVANAINVFGPLTNTNVTHFAILPLALFIVFAGIAYWLDGQRQPNY